MGCSSSVPKQENGPVFKVPAEAVLDEKPTAKTSSNKKRTNNSDDIERAEWEGIKRDIADANERQLEHSEESMEFFQRMAQNRWEGNNAAEFEPALRSGAIALVNAQWLVQYYYNNPTTPIPCRQDLPSCAFVPCNQVIAGSFEGMHIICLSYMWLHPHHPDPKCSTLKLLAYWLQKRMKTEDVGCNQHDWAVFWDFCSLYQHPNPQEGLYRTPEQDQLFQQGLEYLWSLYSHPLTHCYRVTKFPEGYPEKYDLPEDANTTQYVDRGWTFVESSWSSLVKSQDMTYNISTERALFFRDRDQDTDKVVLAPLMPEKMKAALEHKSFTNAKDDRPLVTRLYQKNFQQRFAEVERLAFEYTGWKDSQVLSLAEILHAGYAPKLNTLDLSGNEFGLPSCKVLSKALVSSYPGGNTPMPGIKFSNNLCLDDACVKALVPVLVATSFVNLAQTSMGVEGCRALAAQAKLETHGLCIERLVLDENALIGDQGIQLLASLIVGSRETNGIRFLSLKKCNIGSEGIRALADAADSSRGSGCILEDLDLIGNGQIDEEDGIKHLRRLVKRCPKLEWLTLPRHLKKKKIDRSLRKAMANRDFPERGLQYWNNEEDDEDSVTLI